MLSLIEACQDGRVPAEVGVVIAPSSDAPALEKAKGKEVPTAVVEPGDRFGERLLSALEGCTVLCLAGFMRMLPQEVLDAFPNRVLNIHPALLPKFGGKGMFGMHVHRAVIESGERESGCTIHIVTPVYDEGPIVLQRTCRIFPDDTPETLAQRVLALEHEAYPQALAMVIRGE
jgi:phosphoribosylglycinamide formyltransferase-1